MKDAFQNIDKFKIENMRKIRLQKYDKVKIGFHYTEDTLDKQYKLERSKLYRMNTYYLKASKYFNLKYICLLLISMVFFITCIAPHLFYHLNVIDRHYLGIFDEKIPYLAKDTKK
jgi:hypothetical protein